MIGVSHHFLLNRRKSQNSLATLRGGRWASDAKSAGADVGVSCFMAGITITTYDCRKYDCGSRFCWIGVQ